MVEDEATDARPDMQFGFVTRLWVHSTLQAYERGGVSLSPERLRALQRVAAYTMPKALRRAMPWITADDIDRLVHELRTRR